MAGIRKVIPPIAGVGSFIGQAIGSDVDYAKSSGYWDGLNGTDKAKLVLGDLVSRVTLGHYAPFPDVAGPVTPEFNIGNMLNKFTFAGAALVAYSWFAKKFGGRYLPEGALAGRTGKGMLLGGALGGLLDDPTSGTQQGPSSAQITRSVSRGQYGGLNGR